MRSRNKRQAHYPNRNDNGLAPPGKRVIKKRSNGVLNGHIPVDVANPATGPAVTASSPSTITYSDCQPSSSNAANGSPKPEDMDQMAPEDGRDSLAVSSAVSLDGNISERLAHGSSETAPLPITSNFSVIAATSNNSGAQELRRFVIGSHTLGDIIALLLLLLQLPTPLLTAVQLIYIYTTHADPAAGSWSWSSLTSMPDLFTSRGDNPSIMTTVIFDIFFVVAWFLLPMGNDFVLDLAQVVIAFSFGGGYASTGGATTASICTAIVALCHLMRQQMWRQYAFDFASSVLSRTNIGLLAPPFGLPFFPAPVYSHTARARALLELHIVTQGIIRSFRRLFFQSSNMQTYSSRRRDTDPFLNQPAITNVAVQDPNLGSSRSTSTDGRPPGPPPILREHVKEKVGSSGKKRRMKQGLFARNRQPIWAVFADLKIFMSKEIESSQAVRDAFEAGADGLENFGNGVENCSGERIWISGITDTEASFARLVEPCHPRDSTESLSSSNGIGQGLDDERHLEKLTVYVNDALWVSVKNADDEIIEHSDGRRTRIRTGKVYALPPSTKNTIEFRKGSGAGRPIYSVSMHTRPNSIQDQGSVASTTVQTAPLRPLSPLTTLTNSINSNEARLSDGKARLKKNRKDHKTATLNLKQEVKSLEARISSVGGNDDRQRQRQIQFSQNIRQTEDACADAEREIAELGDIPPEQREAYDVSKQKWQEVKGYRNEARSEFEDGKAEAGRQITAARNETASIKQKREKIEARLTRLQQQRDNLTTSNSQSRGEKDRRENQRIAMLSSWKTKEQELMGLVNYYEQARRTLEHNTAQLEPQHGHFFDHSHVANRMMMSQSPEASTSVSLAGRLPPITATMGVHIPQLAPYTFNQQGSDGINITPPTRSQSASLNQANPIRGRSSSMLSHVSGLTDREVPAEEPQIFQPFANSHANSHLSELAAVGPEDANANSPASTALQMQKFRPIGSEVGRGSPAR